MKLSGILTADTSCSTCRLHRQHKPSAAHLAVGCPAKPADALLLLPVMLHRGLGQGGHGEQGQLHLGHCMAVHQALSPGQVSLQAGQLLLTSPQLHLHCCLHTQHS